MPISHFGFHTSIVLCWTLVTNAPAADHTFHTQASLKQHIAILDSYKPCHIHVNNEFLVSQKLRTILSVENQSITVPLA